MPPALSATTNLVWRDHEQVIATVRRAAIGLAPALILPAVFIVVPFFFLYALFSRGTYGLILFFSVVGFALIVLTKRLIIWQKQCLIITNQRVIDVDQRGLFKRSVSAISLQYLTDTYYETIGLWQTLTRTGNIILLFNDGKTKFKFCGAAQPERTTRLLDDLRTKQAADFDGTPLTTQELVLLVKRIKASLGDKKFRELLADKSDNPVVRE